MASFPPPSASPWTVTPVSAVDWNRLTARLRERREAVVVIPVFNGGDVVRACIRSVLKHTPDTRVVVIDDASTDPATLELLDELAHEGVEVHRHRENRGYTRTANHALALAAPHDVVLLNSDTEVGPGWLTLMRAVAYSDEQCASVTAISDNAGAFAFPVSGIANPWPTPASTSVGRHGSSWDVRSRAVAHGIDTFAQTIPTGHGFCAYLRRSAVDVVGQFDATAFPRGYGEENDWSRRAAAAGLVNLLAPRVMVRHQRSVSFGGQERERLTALATAAVTRKHPDYRAVTSDWMRSAELGALRSRIRTVRDGLRDGRLPEGAGRPRILDVGRSVADRPTAHWIERLVTQNVELVRVGASDDDTSRTVREACALLGIRLQAWPSGGTEDAAIVPEADLPDPRPWRSALVRTISGNPETRVLELAPEALVPGRLSAALAGFADDVDVRVLADLDEELLADAGSSTEAMVERLRAASFRCYLVDEATRTWSPFTPTRQTEVGSRGRRPVLYAVRTPTPSRAVAVVVHSAGLGGGERSHIETVQSLLRQGHLVHTIAAGPDRGMTGEIYAVGGSTSLIGRLPWWISTVGRAQGVASCAPPPELFAALDGVGAEVVMTQTIVVPQGALAAAALHLPHIWCLREFGDRDHGMPLPAGDRLAAGALFHQYSAHVITNSEAVRDHFFEGPTPGVTVLHPCPQPAVVRSPEPRPQRGGRPWALGVLATIIRSKGQWDVVEAVALLRARGIDVAVRFFGHAPPQPAEELRQHIEKHGVGDLVELAGFVGDRAEVFRALDAVAVPSHHEAFGRIPTEATAAGLPLVYCDTAGLAEQFRDGVTGLGYAPGDIAGLADAILRLRSEPELGPRLVAAAQAELLSEERLRTFDEVLGGVIEQAVAAAPVARGPGLLSALGTTPSH